MIQPIRDRLRELLVPNPLKMVEGAAEWAALEAPPPTARRPCAYVLPMTLDPGSNLLAAGGFRQRITQTVAVAICASNLRDARGEAAMGDIDVLLPAVAGALFGWKPEGQESPLLLGPGKLLAASGGLVVWQQLFRSDALITKL